MKIITDERCTGYSSPGHPERPERVSRTVEKLKAQTEITVEWATPAVVETDHLIRAHSKEHLKRLEKPEDFDGDTPYHPGIREHALRSVGGALLALQTARKGGTALSLLRPPGHHAMQARAMGFCYLNSIAIAVLEALGSGSKKVAVFDFDVHHGNGTEAILVKEPHALFYSIHQHPCYPGTGTSNVGNNCFNHPVPPRTPRLEYRKVIEKAMEDMARQKPDLIAVSAGFDAYRADPIAQETLEAEDFQWVGAAIRKLGIPAFSVLEGGYSSTLPELILAYLMGIEGK
jgi:acetoin utilization deacetylase AcuC-like enzyme